MYLYLIYDTFRKYLPQPWIIDNQFNGLCNLRCRANTERLQSNHKSKCKRNCHFLPYTFFYFLGGRFDNHKHGHRLEPLLSAPGRRRDGARGSHIARRRGRPRVRAAVRGRGGGRHRRLPERRRSRHRRQEGHRRKSCGVKIGLPCMSLASGNTIMYVEIMCNSTRIINA